MFKFELIRARTLENTYILVADNVMKNNQVH